MIFSVVFWTESLVKSWQNFTQSSASADRPVISVCREPDLGGVFVKSVTFFARNLLVLVMTKHNILRLTDHHWHRYKMKKECWIQTSWFVLDGLHTKRFVSAEKLFDNDTECEDIRLRWPLHRLFIQYLTQYFRWRPKQTYKITGKISLKQDVEKL